MEEQSDYLRQTVEDKTYDELLVDELRRRDKHVFVNKPGTSECQHSWDIESFCGYSKDHESHIKVSDQEDTYRKPLGLRFDLIPPVALRRLAAVYEEGAKVYGESKYIAEPMPHSNVVKHLMNHLNLAQMGDTTEDHWAKVAWAAFTMIVYTEFNLGDANLSNYGVVPKRKSR